MVPHHRAGRVLAHPKEGRLVNDQRARTLHPADVAALDDLRDAIRREVAAALRPILRDLRTGRVVRVPEEPRAN